MPKFHLCKMSDGTSVFFFCPGCERNHRAIVDGSRGWQWNNNAESPTLTPSIKTEYGNGGICHAFIRDGSIQFLPDCTHKLAGQTVPLPEWPELETYILNA